MKSLLRIFAVVLALDVFGLACVAGTWALAGGGEGGMGPYLLAVGKAAVSLPDLLVYCGLIALYSAGLEAGLRLLVQEPLARRKGRWAHLSAPLAAIAYAATHAVYHPAGVVYALILGSGTALAYTWVRDWRALALWHVQWNALAIGGSLALAMWGPGAPRTAILMAYKADRIEAGVLVYGPGWGWVDRTHMPHAQLEAAEAWAADPAMGPLVLDAKLADVFGGRTPIARSYHLDAPRPGARERWATACAVVIDFHRHHEAAQGEQAWWTGTPMSAFQFDDLPSVVRACLDREPGAEPLELETDRESLRARWASEGAARVAQPIEVVDLPDEVRRAWGDVRML